MIVGTGIDIAEVPRIAQALARHGDRFLHRVFTEGEIRYCDSKPIEWNVMLRALPPRKRA